MKNLNRIIEVIGRKRLAAALGLNPANITNAKAAGVFPATWYPTVVKLLDEQGKRPSIRAFNWRKPNDVKYIR